MDARVLFRRDPDFLSIRIVEAFAGRLDIGVVDIEDDGEGWSHIVRRAGNINILKGCLGRGICLYIRVV